MTPAVFFGCLLGGLAVLCGIAYAIEVAYDCSPRFRDWLERVLPEGDE